MSDNLDEMPQPARDLEPAEAPAAPDARQPEPAQPEDGARPDDAHDDDGIHPLRAPATDAVADAASRSSTAEDWTNLYRMLDIPLSLTVVLGSTEMQLSEVLKLETGSVITIDRAPGEPIDLLINGRLFARGEVVVINETFGCRITELVDDAATTIEIARNGG